jgi:hypothetical protein
MAKLKPTSDTGAAGRCCPKYVTDPQSVATSVPGLYWVVAGAAGVVGVGEGVDALEAVVADAGASSAVSLSPPQLTRPAPY